LTSCSSTKTIVKTEYIKQSLPGELLVIPELNKPIVDTDRDIDAAYVKLHQQYWYLRNNVEAIKQLVDENSTTNIMLPSE
jgi:hypothetical protein